MSASRPGGLGVVGHELGEQAPEADRLGAQLGAHEPVAGAGRVALVEDEVDDGEHAGQAIGHLGVAGHAVGDPCAAAILRLARTRRWAIVGSGTRKARAISAVVSPPSVRRVSATRASIASAG